MLVGSLIAGRSRLQPHFEGKLTGIDHFTTFPVRGEGMRFHADGVGVDLQAYLPAAPVPETRRQSGRRS